MKTLIILLAAMCVPACKPIEFPGPGSEDFIAPLCNGYILARTSAYQSAIVPKGGYGPGTPTIGARVVECNFTESYIIAKRQGFRGEKPNTVEMKVGEPDPDVFDYWVLDTFSRRVYGPLTENEFMHKRSNLGISPSLNLISIDALQAKKY